ncbi:CDP-diacylglycerol--serine O-phosphatidyltransferase [Niallia taxi]|uniref:CDP-diacylglycerol--serine O-phosphatidyltransferase n=1 Tax=Niallia taxi TaxID=2499688 RepID=UPI0011A7FDF6|nr:CDP-diacylglycerol--serine O-phosphatidyltransferase [Niallia taxi]MCT2343230.1 CDP-diacylglycerol--serine O-phosphatidyltransferase [Niallia taxi]MED3962103.1 CDP-diacylglycerol--serine O-phosphatidyltransferase [Niallia taxi]WOD64259.1 CDP-diacylglycerol--serine O-phosphatidyltransferase [Niallia taxi]
MFLHEVLEQTAKKLKAQIANFLTLTNLGLGGFSIIYSLKGHIQLSLLLIFIAALADRLDGMAARKFNIESELGKQLDSMSDIISFGVAPALLLYQAVLFEFSTVGSFFTVLYICCGAFRLARFNITENSGFFTGLPITAAGCIITFCSLGASFIAPHMYLFLLLILSVLMIGNFKWKKI